MHKLKDLMIHKGIVKVRRCNSSTRLQKEVGLGKWEPSCLVRRVEGVHEALEDLHSKTHGWHYPLQI